MAVTLKVVDEFFGGSRPGRFNGVDLQIASHGTTAREIISLRVSTEIYRLRREDAKARTFTRSLLVDADTQEVLLNPAIPLRQGGRTALDIEEEIERANAAFNNRKFIMLVDDRQIDELDDGVGLRPDSEVLFLFLSPLKGG